MSDHLDKLFGISAEKKAAMPKLISVPLGIDTHVHGRTHDDGRMQMVVEACAGEFEYIVDVPNVKGIVTGEDCLTRRRMMQICVPMDKNLRIGQTPLINDSTDPAMLRAAWDRPEKEQQIVGIKIFFEGVSNAYGQFVTRVDSITDLLLSTTADLTYQTRPYAVTIHAECLRDYRGNILPIKDREYWCILNEVAKMLRINPKGIYIIRHVSDFRTLQWIEERYREGYKIYAELSPQYIIQIDDDLFRDEKGHAVLNCDCVYWPRPKDEQSRRALQAILLRCPPWLIYGSDFAMHLHDPMQETGVKINKWGKAVGGLNFLPKVAKSCLIDFCVGHGKPEVLRSLLVDNPAKAYGITLSGTEATYVRQDWVVEDFTTGSYFKSMENRPTEVRALNFLRGETMRWERAM